MTYRIGKRFVPSSTIRDRMDRQDLRFQAEARRNAAARKPIIEVAIVPKDPGAFEAAIVDVTLEPTGADVFGTPTPGEAVAVPDRRDPCRGYAPRYLRGRFGRRSDGKPVRLITPAAKGRP